MCFVCFFSKAINHLSLFACIKVAPYKRLRRVSFVPSVPKSLAGKLLRRELREQVRSKMWRRIFCYPRTHIAALSSSFLYYFKLNTQLTKSEIISQDSMHTFIFFHINYFQLFHCQLLFIILAKKLLFINKTKTKLWC